MKKVHELQPENDCRSDKKDLSVIFKFSKKASIMPREPI
jgi:hypothetical protein